MQPKKTEQDNPDQKLVQQVGNMLARGEVIIHPTETVYGLAGIYDDFQVIEKINHIKQRPEGQPYSIMVNSFEDIYRISGQSFMPWLNNFLQAFLPGPLTVLLPRRKELEPAYWNRFSDIGFRYPDHRLSLLLVQASDRPLITTSANLSGQAPPRRLEEIPPELKEQVSVIIDGGFTREQVPSSVIRLDTTNRRMQLIRAGCISLSKLETVFRECSKQ
jgi:L-threonylcarbamoyladenylate synthase